MTWGWTRNSATTADLQACVGPGWAGLVAQLVKDLKVLGWDGCVFQVKQKFGGLRFYTGNLTAEMQDLVDKAEEESMNTCEQCGGYGETKTWGGGYWLSTLCEHCGRNLD